MSDDDQTEQLSAVPDETSWPPVSVVMPVLNEGRHLAAAVTAVLEQDYPGEVEVVLALGPSRDDTAEVAAGLAMADDRVRTVPNPSGRTPSALNAALEASTHDIIARVDGHSLLPSTHLRTAVRTLQETGADNVGGRMDAEGVTPFQVAVACAMTSPLGVGAARYHTGGGAGPAPSVYLGVFRRAALERVGGYDERFVRAQDWELNHRIRESGGTIWFTPELEVKYRPRPSYEALSRQYADYGRWRRVVMRRYPETVSPRYLAPPVALVGAAGGLLLGLLSRRTRPALVLPLGYAALVTAGAVYAGRGLPLASRVRLPAIFATMHMSWGAGFLTSPKSLGSEPPAEAQPYEV